jgi:hypothetical protein
MEGGEGIEPVGGRLGRHLEQGQHLAAARAGRRGSHQHAAVGVLHEPE